MTDLKNATHIIFDWDNTLDDSFPALFDSWNYTLAKFGKPQWDDATAKKNIRKTAHEIMPEVFGGDWEKAIVDYRAYYYDNHTKPTILPCVEDLLKALKKDGKILGVISNKGEAVLHDIAKQSGLEGYFDVIMGADKNRLGKPDPSTMDIMLDKIGYTGSRDTIWYVGDTDIDIQFAKKAGTKSIFVENAGLETVDSIQVEKPYYAFKTIKDFHDYYKTL